MSFFVFLISATSSSSNVPSLPYVWLVGGEGRVQRLGDVPLNDDFVALLTGQLTLPLLRTEGINQRLLTLQRITLRSTATLSPTDTPPPPSPPSVTGRSVVRFDVLLSCYTRAALGVGRFVLSLSLSYAHCVGVGLELVGRVPVVGRRPFDVCGVAGEEAVGGLAGIASVGRLVELEGEGGEGGRVGEG